MRGRLPQQAGAEGGVREALIRSCHAQRVIGERTITHPGEPAGECGAQSAGQEREAVLREESPGKIA